MRIFQGEEKACVETLRWKIQIYLEFYRIDKKRGFGWAETRNQPGSKNSKFLNITQVTFKDTNSSYIKLK